VKKLEKCSDNIFTLNGIRKRVFFSFEDKTNSIWEDWLGLDVCNDPLIATSAYLTYCLFHSVEIQVKYFILEKITIFYDLFFMEESMVVF
jgi:hypothetical protein